MQLLALEYAEEDHLIWGRLAESYRFIPGREPHLQLGMAEKKLYG